MKTCEREITAIPTQYKGIEMKSRMEAQCACLFDKLRWEWYYEIHSYTLPSGLSYTPDFFIPVQSLIWECRGYESTKGELQISGFRDLMRQGVKVPGWCSCHTYAILRSDGAVRIIDKEIECDAFVVTHCSTCPAGGWFLCFPEAGEPISPRICCLCCNKVDHVDSVIIVTSQSGRIKINGISLENWEPLK